MEVELSFTDALYRNIISFKRKLKNLVFTELCNIYVSNDDYFCIKYSSYQINNRIDLLYMIYSNGCGLSIDGNPTEKNNHLLAHYIKNKHIVPLWCIPNVLTLGEVMMLFSMLPIESQNRISISLGGPTVILENGKHEYKRLLRFVSSIEYT